MQLISRMVMKGLSGTNEKWGKQMREYRVKKADDLIESDNSPLDKKLNVVLKLHNEYKHMSSQANR